MVRVGTGDRLGPAQVRPVRPEQSATEASRAEPAARPSGRALVVIAEKCPEEPGLVAHAMGAVAGGARAGFLTQLLTAGDPTLLPTRLERTQMAAACYAEAARRPA